MKFKIHQSFKILVFPNKLNKDIVTETTSFSYATAEVISEESGLRFKVLKDIYDGNLLPHIEYEIWASLPLFKPKTPNSQEYELFSVPIIDINDVSELEGENPLGYYFMEPIFDEEELKDIKE